MLLTIGKVLPYPMPPSVERARPSVWQRLTLPSNPGRFEAKDFRDRVWIGVKAGDGERKHR